MTQTTDDFKGAAHKSLDDIPGTMEKLLAAARPGAVFGQPVQAGAYTVITASEIATGGGFGTGVGYGGPAGSAETPENAGAGAGGGAGGGGGGGSSGRPVAVIVIGPEGVSVKPIIDPTKLGIALITAWGAMFLAIGRMRRFGKR
jgi:uncharacterized spore protein YtfJ